MKIKNILALLCFLFIGVSCSMEEDILGGVDTKGPDKTNVSETYASIGFSLITDGIQTKSASAGGTEDPNENEKAVVNCYVAVFDKETENLLGSHLYTGNEIGQWTESGYPLATRVLFKIPKDVKNYPDLIIVAVAQMNEDSGVYRESSSIAHGILACNSYSDLMDFTLLEDPNVLVKVGEKELSNKEYPTYITTSDKVLDLGSGQDSHDTFTVPVSQRAGAVELSSFDVKSTTGKITDIQVSEIWLDNTALHAKVKNQMDELGQRYTSSAQYSLANVGRGLLGFRLYSYENISTQKKAALHIEYSYKLDGKEQTGKCDFTIKTPDASATEGYVEKLLASHLYKLDVTITNTTVNVSIVCATMDWKFDKSENVIEFKY